MNSEKGKRISEIVEGKSVNLCHIIANPSLQISQKLAIDPSSIGIVSFTPGEIAIIAADILAKSADLNVLYIDRYLGTVLIGGEIEALKESFSTIMNILKNQIGLETIQITMS